tara:strand:- start:69 stop:617 length:549 start_codon:yes stop_codon:yes gene_type:complete
MKRVDATTLKKQIEAINTLINQEVFDCRLEEPYHGIGCEVHVYKHGGSNTEPRFRRIERFREYAAGKAWVWAITHTIMTYTSLHPFEHTSGRILQDAEFHVDVAIDLMRPRHAARLVACPECNFDSYIEPPKPREAEDSKCTTLEQSFTCPACGHEGTRVWTDGMTQIMDVLNNNMNVTPQV